MNAACRKRVTHVGIVPTFAKALEGFEKQKRHARWRRGRRDTLRDPIPCVAASYRRPSRSGDLPRGVQAGRDTRRGDACRLRGRTGRASGTSGPFCGRCSHRHRWFGQREHVAAQLCSHRKRGLVQGEHVAAPLCVRVADDTERGPACSVRRIVWGGHDAACAFLFFFARQLRGARRAMPRVKVFARSPVSRRPCLGPAPLATAPPRRGAERVCAKGGESFCVRRGARVRAEPARVVGAVAAPIGLDRQLDEQAHHPARARPLRLCVAVAVRVGGWVAVHGHHVRRWGRRHVRAKNLLHATRGLELRAVSMERDDVHTAPPTGGQLRGVAGEGVHVDVQPWFAKVSVPVQLCHHVAPEHEATDAVLVAP